MLLSSISFILEHKTSNKMAIPETRSRRNSREQRDRPNVKYVYIVMQLKNVFQNPLFYLLLTFIYLCYIHRYTWGQTETDVIITITLTGQDLVNRN